MTKFAVRLMEWYRKNGRKLPWRGRSDPYAIWVSEVMLQQTRVEAVIPYFERWMKRFPTIKDLADASEEQVLSFWEGLGYYSRARNLQKTAKIIMAEYAGKLPSKLEELINLPGIGRYTAGAISSIAFNRNEPALDGNIRRVLSRAFNISEPADTATGKRVFLSLASTQLPKGQAGDYNQALMDLGAIVCLPKNPQCPLCPVITLCGARKLGIQSQRPVLKPKKATPHYLQVAAVIRRNGRVLLAKRPSKGLLGGMWEFPNGRIENESARELRKALQNAYGLKVRKKDMFGVIQHTYTHFSVTVQAYYCELISNPRRENLKWVRVVELDHYPMGRIDRQIARKLE